MKIRKHKTIEIYFVLYLAALILLIPDKKEIEEQNSNFTSRTYSPETSLNIEQNTLNCFIDSDSLGAKIEAFDSVNTFFWSDNIESISFDYFIEDATIGSQLKENPYKQISFRTIENIKENKAFFYWEPKLPLQQSKSYIVHIDASAITKKELDDGSSIYQTNKLKGKFGINIVYNEHFQSTELAFNPNSYPQDDRGSIPQIQGIPNANLINLQNFNLYLDKTDMRLIASQNWQNTIFASNINLLQDLAAKPEIKVICEPENNGGEAIISETSRDKIIVKGKAPNFGKTTVQIKVIRKTDKEEVKVSFRLMPQGIEHPAFAAEMYPEKTYTIDPKLPLSSAEVKAYLQDGSKVLAASQHGEKFYFKPEYSLVDKTLTLERYIDNQLFGQKYDIKVLNYPNSEISDFIKNKNGELILTTKCYGKYKQQFNEIVSLEIEGNAKYRELRGNLRSFENPIPTFIQEFIISPANKLKPFEFKVFAIDKKGKKTNLRNFKE